MSDSNWLERRTRLPWEPENVRTHAELVTATPQEHLAIFQIHTLLQALKQDVWKEGQIMKFTGGEERQRWEALGLIYPYDGLVIRYREQPVIETKMGIRGAAIEQVRLVPDSLQRAKIFDGIIIGCADAAMYGVSVDGANLAAINHYAAPVTQDYALGLQRTELGRRQTTALEIRRNIEAWLTRDIQRRKEQHRFPDRVQRMDEVMKENKFVTEGGSLPWSRR